MSKKNIVIIGGGYAGVGIINALEGKLPSTHRIILIEKQDFMYVRLAAARASASEDISEQVLVPYDKLFKSSDTGVVVKASVIKISPHSVVLSERHRSFGSEIEFDYLVLNPFLALLIVGHCDREYLEGSYRLAYRFKGRRDRSSC
jgi:NADH dehydrogenase FAD-containing subunit